MATITPIAYNNSGTPIPGTTQLGNLSIGSTNQDYGTFPSGYRFWATPDEDLHYVVAYEVPAGNHPNPLSVPCFVGFFKTPVKTEESFIELAEYITIQDNDPQTFTGGTDAKTWLNNNNYWTSYGEGGGAVTGNYNLLNQYSPANINGSITFPGSDNAPSNNPNTVGLNPGNGIYINKFDLVGTDQSSVLGLLVGRNGVLTLTQGINSVTYSFTSTAFNFTSAAPYPNQYWWDNFHNGGQSPLGTLTVTSPSPANFNFVDPITITVS